MRTIQEITDKFGMKLIPLNDMKVGDTVVTFAPFYSGYSLFSHLPTIYTVTRKTPAGTKITVTDKISGAEGTINTKGLSFYTYDEGLHDFITDIKFREKLYSFYRGYVQQALSVNTDGQDLPRGVIDKCMRLLCDYFLTEPTDKLKELEEVKDTFVHTLIQITGTLIDRADIKWGDS